MFGEPERGMATLKQGTSEDHREIGSFGQTHFPNFFEAWGRRVVLSKEGKIKTEKNEMVQVTSPEYQGVVDFMKYGEQGGELIYCRYVKGCSSLDYQYQVQRLNLPTKEKDEENLWLTLNNGEMEVDPNMDKAYALALKVHPYNANSISRGGNVSQVCFEEVKRVIETDESIVFDAAFEAMKMLKDASAAEGGDLHVLYTILNRDGEIMYDPNEEGGMFKAMKKFVVGNYEKVLALVKDYKMEAGSIIEQAKASNALFLEKGTLYVGSVNRQTLLTDLSAKSLADALTYLLEVSLTEKGHAAINNIFEKKEENFK